MDGKFEGPTPQILIADDEPAIVDILRRSLEKEPYRVTTAANGTEVLDRLKAEDFDLVVLDILMPGADGIEILKRLKKQSPETEVILITGHASIDTAIEAIRLGAADYLRKPFEDLRLFQISVRKALTRRELVRLVGRYRLIQESAGRMLRSKQEKYENLGEVMRVCVNRSIETIRHLEPLIKAHLGTDDMNELALMKADNEELLGLLDSFLDPEQPDSPAAI